MDPIKARRQAAGDVFARGVLEQRVLSGHEEAIMIATQVSITRDIIYASKFIGPASTDEERRLALATIFRLAGFEVLS